MAFTNSGIALINPSMIANANLIAASTNRLMLLINASAILIITSTTAGINCGNACTNPFASAIMICIAA